MWFVFYDKKKIGRAVSLALVQDVAESHLLKLQECGAGVELRSASAAVPVPHSAPSENAPSPSFATSSRIQTRQGEFHVAGCKLPQDKT